MGGEPLKPVPDSEDWDRPVSRFEFPALDQRQGADPTWADTMDTAARAPKKRDQKPWEWRKESPIRPVVFEDTGTMEEDVVHLHLEHRVVQRFSVVSPPRASSTTTSRVPASLRRGMQSPASCSSGGFVSTDPARHGSTRSLSP